MIKKIYIGTSLNIFIGIIFFLIYFYSNYFVMNDHFYKIKYHEDYKVYNKKFKDEFNTIIDFYFKLIQESDLDVVLIDFNNELLFIVDPIINNNYERAEYLAFKNDVRKIEFKTKRAHKFIHLNNQLYITIQSSK